VAILLGQFVGGLLIIYLLQMLWEFALFRRVLDDPLKGKIASTFTAYLTVSILGGFGAANGGPYAWIAFLQYLPSALVLGAFATKRGLALRAQSRELEGTFD
jgi:hypothetical protein